MTTPRLALAILLVCHPLLYGAGPLTPPRVLILLTADDLNADSAGYLGNRLGATPNLDAFAASCHRFEQCHVTAPICQPSRSALMTGRVPHRNGALGFQPIRQDVPTLVEILAARGYFTAVINKAVHMAPARKFPWHLQTNGSGKNPRVFGEHVAKAIAEARRKGKPLFLNANITDPHRPFPGVTRANPRKAQATEGPVKAFDPAEVAVPSFLEDLPDVRQEVARYYTGVRRFDHSFGEAMKVLERTGLARSAVVVFLSDHGMSFPFSKATVYRNGTWSPLLLRWPEMKKPMADREHLVSSVDLMPTVLELLGVAAPPEMDGRSLVPLIRGEKQEDRDFVITHVNTVSSGKAFPARCVRTRTRSYIWQGWPDGTTRLRVEAMSGLTFKAMATAAQTNLALKARVAQYHEGLVEGLYNLEQDPEERVDRVHDASYRAERDRFRRLLLSHMERTSDPQLAAFRKVAR